MHQGEIVVMELWPFLCSNLSEKVNVKVQKHSRMAIHLGQKSKKNQSIKYWKIRHSEARLQTLRCTSQVWYSEDHVRQNIRWESKHKNRFFTPMNVIWQNLFLTWMVFYHAFSTVEALPNLRVQNSWMCCKFCLASRMSITLAEI